MKICKGLQQQHQCDCGVGVKVRVYNRKTCEMEVEVCAPS